MLKGLKRHIILLFLSAFVLISNAQESILKLHFGPSVSIGETQKFIDRTSWRGVTADFEKYIDSTLSMGMQVGITVFHQKKYGTVSLSSTAEGFGTHKNYLNVIPISYVIHKYYRKKDAIVFAGTSIGVSWLERYTEIGIYNEHESTWPLCLGPEIGMMFPLGTQAQAILKSKYTCTFSFQEEPIEQFFSFTFGLAWE